MEVASGTSLGQIAPFPLCFGPEARELIRRADGEARGYALFQRGDVSPRIVLGVETTPSFPPAFSRDGRLIAWSNANGTVSVCDLLHLRARLAEVGLDW